MIKLLEEDIRIVDQIEEEDGSAVFKIELSEKALSVLQEKYGTMDIKVIEEKFQVDFTNYLRYFLDLPEEEQKRLLHEE